MIRPVCSNRDSRSQSIITTIIQAQTMRWGLRTISRHGIPKLGCARKSSGTVASYVHYPSLESHVIKVIKTPELLIVISEVLDITKAAIQTIFLLYRPAFFAKAFVRMESRSNNTGQQLPSESETTRSPTIGEGLQARVGGLSGAPGEQSNEVRFLCFDFLNSCF